MKNYYLKQRLVRTKHNSNFASNGFSIYANFITKKFLNELNNDDEAENRLEQSDITFNSEFSNIKKRNSDSSSNFVDSRKYLDSLKIISEAKPEIHTKKSRIGSTSIHCRK